MLVFSEGGCSDLMSSLAKAQAAFPSITKDFEAEVVMKSGGKFSYSYADLGTILAKVRPVLGKEGIAVMQPMRREGANGVIVQTWLLHSSGQTLHGPELLITADDGTAQKIGSASTYARRYQLSALLGLAAEEEDDDGAAASGHTSQASRRPAPQRVSRPEDRPASISSEPQEADLIAAKPIVLRIQASNTIDELSAVAADVRAQITELEQTHNVRPIIEKAYRDTKHRPFGVGRRYVLRTTRSTPADDVVPVGPLLSEKTAGRTCQHCAGGDHGSCTGRCRGEKYFGGARGIGPPCSCARTGHRQQIEHLGPFAEM